MIDIVCPFRTVSRILKKRDKKHTIARTHHMYSEWDSNPRPRVYQTRVLPAELPECETRNTKRSRRDLNPDFQIQSLGW